MFICPTCNKSFNTNRSLAGHQRIHTTKEKLHDPICCCIYTKVERLAKNLEKYQQQLRSCKNCTKLVRLENTYCSSSCAASVTNTTRVFKDAQQRKQKISKSVQAYYQSTPRSPSKQVKNPAIRSIKKVNNQTIWKKPPAGVPYSKLYTCSCKHCNTITLRRQVQWYCDQHCHLYSSNGRAKYKFKFNVYHYPDLFDLKHLAKVGFFAPRGKAGKWNPNGLSRDHKVSVNDAIKFNYDPYYITHPMNCQLIPHVVNNTKNTNSCISYVDLVRIVDDYDSKQAPSY